MLYKIRNMAAAPLRMPARPPPLVRQNAVWDLDDARFNNWHHEDGLAIYRPAVSAFIGSQEKKPVAAHTSVGAGGKKRGRRSLSRSVDKRKRTQTKSSKGKRAPAVMLHQHACPHCQLPF